MLLVGQVCELDDVPYRDGVEFRGVDLEDEFVLVCEECACDGDGVDGDVIDGDDV